MSLFGNIGSQPWMESAKCLDLSLTRGPSGELNEVDRHLFPPDPNGHGPGQRFCNGRQNEHGTWIDPPCPVRAECLDYALANDEWYGVWGGKSPLQRRHEKKRREAAGAKVGGPRYERALPPEREGVTRRALPLGIDFNAVLRGGNGCAQCQTRASAVTNADRDLGDLARRASQSDEIAAKLTDQIAQARAERDQARRNRDEHTATCLIAAAGA